MNAQDCFIGLDVSKDTLEVAVRPTEERKTFANQEDGLSLMIDFVKPFSPSSDRSGGDGRPGEGGGLRLRG